MEEIIAKLRVQLDWRTSDGKPQRVITLSRDHAEAVCSALKGEPRMFKIGDAVMKRSGAEWHGRVCGFYSTTLTPVGYAVESTRELGSVQIYPEAALQHATE